MSDKENNVRNLKSMNNEESIRPVRKKRKRNQSNLCNVRCLWKNCDFEMNILPSQYKGFSDHLQKHCNDFISFLQKDSGSYVENDGEISLSYACLWECCPWEGCDDLLELSRHIMLHGYQAMLRGLGDNERVHLELESCQMETDDIYHVLGSLNMPFCCEWNTCTLEFCCPNLFYRHVETHVGDDSMLTYNENKKVLCHWQGCCKTFGNRHKLKDHLRVHTREKVIACYNCGAMFSNKTKLVDHLSRQNEQAYENFQCSHCLKRFPSERLLRDHMRHHVNYLKCPQCDMTCPNPGSLRYHISYRHSDERPYPCSMCEQRFKSASDLCRHEESHLDPGYVCTEEGCDFTTKTAHCMNRHIRVIHNANGRKKYQCHICHRLYSRGFSLTKHLKKEHNFSWPSGHPRFRYIEYEDGIYRLQMVRFESAELTERLLAQQNSADHTPNSNIQQATQQKEQGDKNTCKKTYFIQQSNNFVINGQPVYEMVANENVLNTSIISHESVTNTPMVSTENVLNTSIISHESATNAPMVSTENVLNMSLISHESVTNTPVVSTENVLNTSIVSHESVTNTPMVSSENVLNTSIISHESVTNTPMVSSENVLNTSIISHESVTNTPMVSSENVLNTSIISHESVTNTPIISDENVTNTLMVCNENIITTPVSHASYVLIPAQNISKNIFTHTNEKHLSQHTDNMQHADSNNESQQLSASFSSIAALKSSQEQPSGNLLSITTVKHEPQHESTTGNDSNFDKQKAINSNLDVAIPSTSAAQTCTSNNYSELQNIRHDNIVSSIVSESLPVLNINNITQLLNLQILQQQPNNSISISQEVINQEKFSDVINMLTSGSGCADVKLEDGNIGMNSAFTQIKNEGDRIDIQDASSNITNDDASTFTLIREQPVIVKEESTLSQIFRLLSEENTSDQKEKLVDDIKQAIQNDTRASLSEQIKHEIENDTRRSLVEQPKPLVENCIATSLVEQPKLLVENSIATSFVEQTVNNDSKIDASQALLELKILKN